MNAFPKNAARLGTLAVGILLISTFGAAAEKSHTGLRAQCIRDAHWAYDIQVIEGCGDPEYLAQYGPIGGQAACIADAAEQLHDALEDCQREPERQGHDAGTHASLGGFVLGGGDESDASATHGSSTPNSNDAGDSGGSGDGGNGGGTGANLGDTFNPSMGNAPMSVGRAGFVIQ